MKLSKSKRGLLSELPQYVLMFAVAFIILGFGAIFLTQLRDSAPHVTLGDNTSGGYMILNESLKGAAKIGEQGSNIGMIIAIIVIIGLLISSFGYLMYRKNN